MTTTTQQINAIILSEGRPANDVAAVQRYLFGKQLAEAAKLFTIKGHTVMQVADAICETCGWCFLTSTELKILGDLRSYLLGEQ